MKVFLTFASGLSCGLIGLIVSYLVWDPFPPFQIQVYQELQTDRPEAGFEGYADDEEGFPFYWDEIVATKAFRSSVAQKLEWEPELELAPASIQRYMEFDQKGTDQMFLSVFYYHSEFAPPPFEQEKLQLSFESYATTFLEAAEARGVEIERIGPVVVSWRQTKSLGRFFTESHTILIFAAVAAALSGYAVSKQAKSNQSSQTRSTSGPV